MTTERVDDWLQLIAATEYLAAVQRPGFTVMDAIEEALRRWTQAYLEPINPSSGVRTEPLWDDPDPLRTTIEQLLATVPPGGSYDGHAIADVMTAAVQAWVHAIAEDFNEGHLFRLRWEGDFPATTCVVRARKPISATEMSPLRSGRSAVHDLQC